MWFTWELLKTEESVIGFLFTVSFQFYKCVCVCICVCVWKFRMLWLNSRMKTGSKFPIKHVRSLNVLDGTPESQQDHSSKVSILWCSAFCIVQLSHPYMTTRKTTVLTRWTSVAKVMSLLLYMLSRLVMAFLPRSKRLLISWLQSPSAVVLDYNFFFHNILIWFWYQGNIDFVKCVWKLSPFFNILEEFDKDRY